MTWVSLILASAFLLGLYDVAKKHAVHGNAVLCVLWLGTLFGFLAVVLTLLVCGTLAEAVLVGWSAWWKLLVKSALVTGSWVFGYYAMRALPISIAAPIRGSQPVWTLLGAFLIFRESPSALQWLGLVVVLGGYVHFSVVGQAEGIHFERHKGVWALFAATLLGAASAMYDKYLLQPCGLMPSQVQFWFSVDLVALTGLVLFVQKLAGLSQTAFTWRWSIPVVGIVLVVSDWLYFSALHQPDTLISILSPIRRSNCVVSFLIGAVWFGDTNRRKKAWGLLAIVVGVIILCLPQILEK